MEEKELKKSAFLASTPSGSDVLEFEACSKT